MKNLSLLFTVVVGGMCVLQSCDKDDDIDYLITSQDFVTQASSSNKLEIMAGELAQSKGQMDTVKKYGQHMVQSHSMAEAELSALATSKGLTVPQSMITTHQNNYNVLNGVSPEQFDERYAELMLVSHEDTYNLFYQAAQINGVPDPELRAWAASKLPELQMHFEEAADLYRNILAAK